MSNEADMFKAEDAVHVFDESSEHALQVEELQLPSDFKWGAATAAYQVEGGAFQDGKGLSIWDTYSHLQPTRTNGADGDIACDHYNRLSEDVKLMKSLGLEVYRFSISWSRLIPLGGRNDPINEKGIMFYSKLINLLIMNGIEPVPTLYHWDVPQQLYDRYGAFLDLVEFKTDFINYARLCFTRFGDRIKRWITFNEPYIISIFGHLNGTLAPGHCASMGTDTKTEPWIVGHNIILSHAAVTEIYMKEFRPAQEGSISIVLNGHYYEPYDATNVADRDAAQCRLEFYIGWFGDPIFLGKDYPKSMRSYLGDRLPTFTTEDKALLQRTSKMNDFYGMNHYSTKYARSLSEIPTNDDWTGNIEETSINSEGAEIGPVSGVQWLRTAPDGFRKLLNWVWGRYHLPIIVTENGCPCPHEDSLEVAREDTYRQRYFGLYLDAISRAIYEDRVVVQGYYAWSLMDNFEWSAGYGPRFGIVHVDFDTLERTPKQSAYYLNQTFKRRRATSL